MELSFEKLTHLRIESVAHCVRILWLVGTTLAQRNNFRTGPGHPTSQRHLPKRPTDPPPSEEDYEPTDQCPEANGFFPDLEQCDKYYSCFEGKPTERLCADGMVFNDYSSSEEKCDLPYNIDCSKRSKLRESFLLDLKGVKNTISDGDFVES
ncbi:unnamed protein product [Ceratitis capitata]|uniref:(Mediterranean fruit fly) hypothetical protein n=1 Tax=Ceratitis capitata TaxID=7213 RepID=A0A811UCU4_CERCA|nr:unnamed protein product [Ceratitis capitata]